MKLFHGIFVHQCLRPTNKPVDERKGVLHTTPVAYQREGESHKAGGEMEPLTDIGIIKFEVKRCYKGQSWKSIRV